MANEHAQQAKRISRRHIILASSAAAAAAMMPKPRAMAAETTRATAAEAGGISRSAESIHQEVSFTASAKRIFAALTESKRFDRVVQLSGVMQSAALAQMKKPTEIGTQEGSSFSAFGGYITGRQIELIQSQRIVQAWRVGSWESGVYSIARFVLLERGPETTLQFDHTGFPVGQADHLAAGWKEHYWEPLRKYLSEA